MSLLTPDLIEKINTTLLRDLPPIKSDVGLVFGQGVYSLLLVPKAAEGLAQGRYPKIIISGGAEVLKTPDAQALIGFMKQNGVTNDHLPREGEREADYIFRLLPDFAKAVAVCERNSLNTGENVALSRPLGLDEATSITTINSASATMRVLGTLRKNFPDPQIKPISTIPVYPPGINASNWPHVPFAANSMVGEFQKLTAYEQEGFIVAVDLDRETECLLSSGKLLPTATLK